ncbi:protein kinase domain-containing protein [Phenylobacterium sp.]|uniref:protein kinase domain-containing protein n=1 Tax=Phenylobacterium sp. TaxID=1871053 RepID=UPI00286C6804|nr:phosphotransferase [Phenylobacterium sp.]
MSAPAPGLGDILFTLPADARLVPVRELSPRLQARIGPVDPGQVVVSRPGFRVTTRLVTPELARLMAEFRAPRRLVDAVLRFSRDEARDPFATLDDAFGALATLIDGRVLVPADSPEAQGLPPSLAAGQALAGYEVEALVQALEDSEVYRALSARGQPVALKVARAGARSALAHEARVLAHLGGGDTPRLIEAGEAGGRPFLAMAWRPGVSVAFAAQRMRASGDRPRARRMVAALLAAYGRLHAKGVIHGDIHPGNILIDEAGRVTLLDFGRARLDAAEGADPARAGIAHFYEPEMARALLVGQTPPASTARSEQYALASLGYFLLTGLHPVDPSAEHRELLARIVTRPPLPFTARGVAAWPGVERVLATALSKDPAERFPDVGAFAAAFAAAPPARPWPRAPLAAANLLEAALERVLRGWQVETSVDALPLAWLALRAALGRGDGDLLAAADLWASRAGPGWTAAAVRAEVARARCDSAAETEAITAFMAAADRADGPAPLLAAARLLDGGAYREADAAPLAGWAVRRLDRLRAADPAPATLAQATLALSQAGVAPLPDGLCAQLDALPRAAGDVWLWGLAHGAFAEPRYAERALEAARRTRDGLARLRAYQLTGDRRSYAAARRGAYAAARRAPAADDPGILETALLLLELVAPQRVIRPPFELWIGRPLVPPTAPPACP